MMRLATVVLGVVLVLVIALTLRRPPGADIATASPTSVAAVVPTPVPTVTERFSRPPLPPVSSKTGLPLATAGPPRGAPPTPTPDPAATPVAFGPFRLIPPLWEGETTSEVVPLPSGMVVSADPAVVSTSPLYRAVPPELLRGDLTLVRAEAGTVGVVLNFDSASDDNLSLQIVRLARTTQPENRRIYGGTRRAIVEGRYVLVDDSYPPGPIRGLPPGSESRPYRIIVTAGAGGLVVEVEGIGYDEATLIEIAKAMVP